MRNQMTPVFTLRPIKCMSPPAPSGCLYLLSEQIAITATSALSLLSLFIQQDTMRVSCPVIQIIASNSMVRMSQQCALVKKPNGIVGSIVGILSAD